MTMPIDLNLEPDEIAPFRGLSRRSVTGGLAAALTPMPCASAARPMQGVDAAFDYLYPLFEFSRALRRSNRPLNQITHRTTLSTAAHRAVTMPNNDCLYSSAFLDLAAGPALITTRDETRRYWSLAFMSAHTDNFTILGTRTTGGRGGRYLLVAPDWRGPIPRGVSLLRAPTTDVWMLGRVLVTGEGDLPAARAVQQRLGLEMPPAPPERWLRAGALAVNKPEDILSVGNELLGRSPNAADTRRGRRHAAWGVIPGQLDAAARLSAAQRAAWQNAIPEGLDRLRATYLARPVGQSWARSGPRIGSIRASDTERAAVALGGLAALPQEEAVYFTTGQDDQGSALDPAGTYEMVIPTDLPLRGFWSLSLYERHTDGRYFFVDNPIGRYAISDRTGGVLRRSDGAIVVRIQRTAPPPGISNWLPSAPGPMLLSLRAYLPGDGMLRTDWLPPPIRRTTG